MLEKAIHTVKNRKKKVISPFAHTWRHQPIGFPRLAERIAVKPETGIYRRFDALNARHILYLQAELNFMEQELKDLEQKDNRSKVGKRSGYAMNYKIMLEDPVSENTLQLELLGKIRKKLNQYNKALLRLYQLHQISAPDRFDLSDVQCLLHSDEMMPGVDQVLDTSTWGTPYEPDNHAPDLIGIRPREKADKFTRFISENAIHLFKCGLGRLTKGNKHVGRKIYYDSTVTKATLWITSILASLLPIASILVLVNLDALKAKLWTIAAFNVATSACLNIFAEAKRQDVFAITAAFAAVQVVFVASSPSNGTST